MSATIYGFAGTAWNCSGGVFCWTLESMANRTHDRHLHEVLWDRAESGVTWLHVDEFPRAQQRELLRLLRETPAAARRDLPQSDYREAVIARFDELSELVARSEAAAPTASVYGTNSTVWEGPLHPFSWALESMAARTTDGSLGARLREIAQEGPYCFELGGLAPAAYAEILTLLPTLPALAREDPTICADASGALSHIEVLSRLQ